jgi:DNA-binding NtrC family response regulator
MVSSEFGPDPIPGTPTQITYVDGRPAIITLRRCKLVVATQKGTEERHFETDTIQIGALDDNDLVLEDATVSRNHCAISIRDDEYFIRDLDSTNGTFVNGVRIREAWLRPDMLIRLGTTEIRFLPYDERVRIVPTETDRFGDLWGSDRKMREIYAILEKIAPTNANVVIEGETGTGKEVVARTIHRFGTRALGPFMVFDCGAVPKDLIEAELFGHEKGSFTGAEKARPGIFELAHGGSVFLDELGELALDLQPKLLRVLEQREIRRIGSTKSLKVDVRVIAATNRNLEEEVRAGRFREDLFYRLNVVRLVLPPLRERRKDVELLAQHFLEHRRSGREHPMYFGPSVLDHLIQYDWPGNVRELQNAIERAVSFAAGPTIGLADLPPHIVSPHPEVGQTDVSILRPELRPPTGAFKDAKEHWLSGFEREYVTGLLRKNNGNISHAAREAEIDRKHFRKLMKKHGISAHEDDSNEGD